MKEDLLPTNVTIDRGGSVLKETIALQFPSRYQYACKIDTAESFSEISYAAEWEKCVEIPKSQRKRVPVEECLDGPARITLKELAITHFVKNGTLQNACSTSPRTDADLVKSALMRIARLMNSVAKGLKIMMTKVQWQCWKIYSIGRKISWRIHVVRGEINKKTAYIQARSSMARALEVNGKSMPSWRRSKNGLKKRFILKTLENCEESISSTRRIRNSKKPLRTRVRSWKHQWLLLCTAKFWKNVGVVHPTKLKQNLRVFWKLKNPQECVWEIRYRIIMKTILQEKVRIH